jgi:hypothetical protein
MIVRTLVASVSRLFSMALFTATSMEWLVTTTKDAMMATMAPIINKLCATKMTGSEMRMARMSRLDAMPRLTESSSSFLLATPVA